MVSDVPSCGGVAYAREHGITCLTHPASKKGTFRGLTKEELAQQLQDMQVDYVLLAGYLKVCWVCLGVPVKQPAGGLGQHTLFAAIVCGFWVRGCILVPTLVLLCGTSTAQQLKRLATSMQCVPGMSAGQQAR